MVIEVHLARNLYRPLPEACAARSGGQIFEIEQLIELANRRLAHTGYVFFQFFHTQMRTLDHRPATRRRGRALG
jgi:hypothetical protein